MRVLLDNIIFSLQRSGGISVYWGELIKGFQQLRLPVTYIERDSAYANLQRQKLILPQGSRHKEAAIPLWLARYLPAPAPHGIGAIFHSSYYRPVMAPGVTTVVTVHDFTYEKYFHGLKRSVHGWQKRKALQQAAIIICLSENTQRDLLALHPYITRERVRVIPLAASREYRPLAKIPLQLRKQNILFVGSRSGYKNFSIAVETVARMPDKHLSIIGGGALSPEEQRLLEKNLPGRYQHNLVVQSEELNRMYNTAYCLLYPSSYEGFGIPPLEALQAGCPVVATRGSSLPEVCGDAALLATTPTPDLFLELLQRLASETERMSLRELGFRQAAKFSWEKTCRETLACYQEAWELAGQLEGK